MQIGSALGSSLGQLAKLDEHRIKLLVACGAAGGIAATVQRPTRRGVRDGAHPAMRARHAVADASLQPAVYWRITDNWLELSLRFLIHPRGVREVKDRMNRDILTALDTASIGIASPPTTSSAYRQSASPHPDFQASYIEP